MLNSTDGTWVPMEVFKDLNANICEFMSKSDWEFDEFPVRFLPSRCTDRSVLLTWNKSSFVIFLDVVNHMASDAGAHVCHMSTEIAAPA